MPSRATLTISLVALLAAGCNAPDEIEAPLRPSLTMFRIGEASQADWDEPVIIPEDHYLPGIVEGPQDFFYPDEGTGFRRAPDLGLLTDLGPMIDLEDPAPLDKHVADYPYSRSPGELVDSHDEQDLWWEDVQQGAIGDCYLAAALSAVLFADDERIVRDALIRELTNENGEVTHFAVRFYDAWSRPQDVQVDVDIVRRSGKPLYMRSADSNSNGEEWAFNLIEKAYAQWHGGYEKIGNGGWAGDFMQAVSGSKATYRSIKALSDRSIIDGVTSAVAERRPIVAGTFGEDDGVDYSGSGVYAWHAYSVHGVAEIEGAWHIELRNPWGSSEPSPDLIDGKNDGRFMMKLSDFRRLYQGITYGGGFRPDTTAPAAVTDLSLVEVVGTDAFVRFTASGDDGRQGLAARYDLRVSNAPIELGNFYDATQVQVATPQAPGATETFKLPLPDGVSYIALRVEDESGNISPLSNVVSVTTGGPAEAITFDVEGDMSSWTMTGMWHVTDLDATSGERSFWFGDESTIDYSTSSRPMGDLTTPVLDLTGMAAPKLLWQQLLDVEDGADWDKAWIEASTESGGYADWQVVWQKISPQPNWHVAEADLGAVGGHRVQLRWRFDAVDDQSNNGVGWLVDDIAIVP